MSTSTISRKAQLNVRMTFSERLEAKMMAEALGFTLDGFVKEALCSVNAEHPDLYDSICNYLSDRAKRFTLQNNHVKALCPR